jgi:hypothetical protein
MEGTNSRWVLRSIQINSPSLHRRQLLETGYVRTATRMAQQLSPQCILLNDSLLMKPANGGAGTPYNDPRTHAFECAVSFSDEQSVCCPLPAGGCVLHGRRTLHCSTNTVSSVDRYAYLLTFGVPQTPSRSPRKAPWLEQRQSADQLKKRAWMVRGGVFVLLLRRFESTALCRRPCTCCI